MKKTGRIVIRRIRELRWLKECEILQKRVWQFPDIDVVPSRFMAVASRNGGMVIGAFDRERMVGFAFSYAGEREGRRVHCSHMLAVIPEYSGRRIGFRLKQAQRRFVLRKGIAHMLWTFDPLEGRNAHLNIHRLGAEAWEYWVNLYGRTRSILHGGLDTDRLVARWSLDGRRAAERANGRSPGGPSIETLLSGEGRVNRVSFRAGVPRCGETVLDRRSPLLTLEIPYDMQPLRMNHPRAARSWQLKTRALFQTYFRRGYRVVDFVSGRIGSEPRSCYRLEKKR